MNKLHEWARRVLPVRTLLLMALGLFLVLIAAGYIFDWQWTGFPNKNLFNWLATLFFPAAVAVGSFLLNQAAKRRDEATQQRAEERAKQLALRSEFRKELSQAYNAAKRVRRTLRAKTRTDHGELQIDMQAYDDLMHELIDIQLRFELLRDDAQVLFLPGDAGVDRRRNVRSALDECEGYLAEIIKEYEYQDDNADAWKPISTGSNLAKFISRSSADKTFKTRLAEPVHPVQEMVIEELISSREISAASLPTSAGQCEAS